MAINSQNLFVLVALVLLCTPIYAVQVFDVYRLFQADKALSPLGSQRVSINLPAASPSKDGSLSRHMVIVPFSQIKSDTLESLVNTRNADGILVLLPRYNRRTPIDHFRQIETELAQHKFNVPVYFAWDDATLQDVYRDVDRASNSVESSIFDLSANQYQLVVPAPEATPVKEVSMMNFQSKLNGVTSNGQSLPTIAIVAHYDSFGVVPALSNGGATGAAALLELSRLFSRLYDNPKTQPKYNLVFVLTAGGNLNYFGAKNWLSSTDVRLLENIEFALCLDQIDRSDLNLHVSRLAKEGNAVKLYESFSKTADAMGVTLNYVTKKINISNPDIDWEHEQFSRKKILSATLSSEATSFGPLTKSHIYDVRERIDDKVFVKNIKFVAESVAKHLYGYQNRSLDIFEGSLDVNKDYVTSWLSTLMRESRASPYIPKKSQLLTSLEKALRQYISDTTTATFPLGTDSEYVFYEFSSFKSSMSFYRSKPILFDVLLLAVILAYLTGLYSYLKGPMEVLKQVKNLIDNKPKKVVKRT